MELPGLRKINSPALFSGQGQARGLGWGTEGNETSPGVGGAPGNLWDSVAPDICSLDSTPPPHFF